MSFLYSLVTEYIYLGIAYYIRILGCTTPAGQRLASTSLRHNRRILPHRSGPSVITCALGQVSEVSP